MSELDADPGRQRSLLPRWANPARWSRRGQRMGWIALCLVLLAVSPVPWVTAVNMAIVYAAYRVVRWAWRIWERVQVRDAASDDDGYGLLTVEQRAWEDLVHRLKSDES